MEKPLLILAASALATKEVAGETFPFTENELWTLLFILIASLVASWGREASKTRKGGVPVPLRFWGTVVIGVMAGLCFPLLLSWGLEHFGKVSLDARGSIGIAILAAYGGRDVMNFLWSLFKIIARGVADVLAKAKGISLTYDETKVKTGKSGPSTPPAETGGDDVDRS